MSWPHCSHRHVRLTDDEHGRCRNAPIAQFCDQLQAPHGWQSLIDNKTVAGTEVASIEEIGAAAVTCWRLRCLRRSVIWTPGTVAKLFELGPATFTPGTKMPQQTIGSADDRAALVKFLEKATK